MITQLRVQNFKSWQDTEPMPFAPLTALFGANSSGKTALLQLLLMLKQTIESADRSRVLHTGDEKTYVDLGTFSDIIYNHQLSGKLAFTIGWTPSETLHIADPEKAQDQTLFSIEKLALDAVTSLVSDTISVNQFNYRFTSGETTYSFGMRRKEAADGQKEYDLTADNYPLKRYRGRQWPLPAPIKSYGFPDQVKAYYQNVEFVSELVLAFEQLFQGIYYLGPLREYPRRSYVWAGDEPGDVGRRGERAVQDLLATHKRSADIKRPGKRGLRTVEKRVAEWLHDLELLDSFALKLIAENRKEYEVKVRRSPETPEVLITDVGFGVSQILPVLVLCYYAPKGSTLILEQPEIHLHPAAQAGLADVFIEVIKNRNIQIIIESHSEHLLHRLQRRIAEGELPSDQAALYFTKIENGRSNLQPLRLDLFGNITNWPAGFFGDPMGDLVAMTEAEMRRRIDAKAAQ